MFNKVMMQACGYLGADAEVTQFEGGNRVCELRVAVNERVKRGDDWVDHTTWITLKTGQNRLIDRWVRYGKKGTPVIFSGIYRPGERRVQVVAPGTGEIREMKVCFPYCSFNAPGTDVRFLAGSSGNSNDEPPVAPAEPPAAQKSKSRKRAA